MKINKGFTLIELLAVIVVIAIVSAIGTYAVMSLINASKMKALNTTAIEVRKSAETYISGERSAARVEYFDLTPGSGEYEHLVDVGKDPWGDPYRKIIAIQERTGADVNITIYFGTEKSYWYLLPGTNELQELPLKPFLVTAPTGVVFPATINVSYSVLKFFDVSAMEFVLRKNTVDGPIAQVGTDLTNPATDYTIISQSLTPTPEGIGNKFNLVLAPKPGVYYLSIKVDEGSFEGQYSTPMSFEILPPPPPTFSSLQILQTVTTPGAWVNTFRRIEFRATNPSTLPIHATVEKWNGSTWVTIVNKKTITAGITYLVVEGNVVGNVVNGLSYGGDHYYSDDPYEDSYWMYFKFKITISNGYTSSSSGEMYYENTEFES